jgi:hypothetical protein
MVLGERHVVIHQHKETTMLYKITYGFVIQRFDNNNKFVSQEFVANDQVEYENENGTQVGEVLDELPYVPFEMVQPNTEMLEKDDNENIVINDNQEFVLKSDFTWVEVSKINMRIKKTPLGANIKFCHENKEDDYEMFFHH